MPIRSHLILPVTPVADQARPPIASHEDTPVVTEDSYTEQEELFCRVWSAVYGYRAELIATASAVYEKPGPRNASPTPTSRSTWTPAPGNWRAC